MSAKTCRICGKSTMYKDRLCSGCGKIERAANDNRPSGYSVPAHPQHTPTPWKVWPENGQSITTDRTDAKTNMVARAIQCEDAVHIVQCVNSHDELLAIVKAIAEQFNEGGDKVYKDALWPKDDEKTLGEWINEAITRAEGK